MEPTFTVWRSALVEELVPEPSSPVAELQAVKERPRRSAIPVATRLRRSGATVLVSCLVVRTNIAHYNHRTYQTYQTHRN